MAHQTQQSMQQAPGSLGLKRQSSGDSLLFSPSIDDKRLDATSNEEAGSYDPVLEVQRIKLASALSIDSERKLSAAVTEAKACSILQNGTADLLTVGRYLRSKYGYLVYIRHANMHRRPKTYLRLLRHDYLVVRGLDAAEGADVLVDLNFKDHFVLPHSTPWYSKLVAALPQDWIGTVGKLAPVLDLMSAAIRLCFKQAGVPLPPWREGRAVVSKWLCEVYVDEPLPVVPLPDSTLRRMLAPYHKPFRAAVNCAATWPEQQQLSPAVPGHQQQQHTMAGRASPLPPLPRAPSSIALATAAVRAAAADAAAGAALVGSHGGRAAVGAARQSIAVVADVPRKIIVGFPDQQLKPSKAAAAADTSPITADADVYLHRHQQPISKQQQQQQPQQLDISQCGLGPQQIRQVGPMAAACQQLRAAKPAPAAANPPAAAAAAAPAGPVEETVRNGRTTGGLKALAQAQPTSTAAAVAERRAATGLPGPADVSNSNGNVLFAGCEATVKVVLTGSGSKCSSSGSSSCRQEQQPPVHRSDVSAFTTSGVVTATGQGSPGLASSRQLLQSQAAAIVAAAEMGGAQAAAAAVRRFRPLDQLLPKMKVIKLGC